MRKSLLATILLATVVGCGDDGTGPEQTVEANLIIDFDAWDESEGA